MIDAEIAVIPVGTCSTSTSDFIAQSEKALLKHPALTYKITGMATEIEGENIDDIFNALKDMHIAQLEHGANRVQTTIRIDERRDRQCTLSEKVSSVKSKI